MTDKSAKETPDLVEKCARALLEADIETFGSKAGVLAVIDALADGVSDEMVLALGLGVADDVTEKQITEARLQLQANGPEIQIVRRSLSAAIRAAKSREGNGNG